MPVPVPVQGGFLLRWGGVRLSPSLQSILEQLLGPEGPQARATAHEMLKSADTITWPRLGTVDQNLSSTFTVQN